MTDTTQGQSMRRWTLVLVGPGELRTYAIPHDRPIVIGREPSCALAIDHPRVSRRHAELRVGANCSIIDLGSRNGTVVRGEALAHGVVCELAAGESFTLGPFTAMLVDEPADAAAPSSLTVEDPAPATPPATLVTVAKSPLPVLIRGETGTGTESLAETLHHLSGRSGTLVRLDCAGFSPELLESELFGVATKPGLLEVAAGGTVFLDEIGELPAALQARLLRAIEAREVLRVGGTRPVAIDVRFLAATHRDLQAEIARGAFRLDLYYRLAVVTLRIFRPQRR